MAARLSAPRTRRKPTPSPTAPPRAAVPGDNGGEEYERIQLIRFVGLLDAADVEVERAAGPYKAALAARSAIKKNAKGAGFGAEELAARRAEMAQSSGENARQSAREARHRKWLGITSPEQQKMHLEEGTPVEARDEEDWNTEGYKLGLRGRAAELPPTMDARFTQPFMKGHEVGFKAYIATLAENVPKPKGMTAEEVAAQAAADYAADNPEIDVEKAARKLKNDPKFMDRSAPANEQLTGEDVAAMATQVLAEKVEEIKAAGLDDGFEATAEELAAQKPRQAVVEAREGDAGAEVV